MNAALAAETARTATRASSRRKSGPAESAGFQTRGHRQPAGSLYVEAFPRQLRNYCQVETAAPSTDSAQEAAAPAPDVSADSEIPSLRTRTSRTYLLADGDRRALI